MSDIDNIEDIENIEEFMADVSGFLEDKSIHNVSSLKSNNDIGEAKAFIDKKYSDIQVNLLSESVIKCIEKKMTYKFRSEINALKVSMEEIKSNIVKE